LEEELEEEKLTKRETEDFYKAEMKNVSSKLKSLYGEIGKIKNLEQ